MQLTFTCDPANKDRLTAMALQEVDRLQGEAASTEEVGGW